MARQENMSVAMGRSSTVTITLAILCLALGWLVYKETERPAPMTSTGVPVVSTGSVSDPAKIAPRNMAIVLPPIDAFQGITSRPLFNVSRRPIAVDNPPPVEERAELNVMLSGIVIGHSQQIAHLRSSADKRVQVLSVGDRIGGWRIEAIEPDRVVLRSGNQVETLFMQKYGSGDTATGRSDQKPETGVKSRKRRSQDRSRQRERKRYRRYNRRSNR